MQSNARKVIAVIAVPPKFFPRPRLCYRMYGFRSRSYKILTWQKAEFIKIE